MFNIIVAGAGRMGTLIALQLIASGDYKVVLFDQDFNHPDIQRLPKHKALSYKTLNVLDAVALKEAIASVNATAIISSLPYFANAAVAQAAKAANIHYFDLTEDREVTRQIQLLAKNSTSIFVPQCGLAPGFVGIAAYNMIQHFDKVEAVKMRVGALPVNTNNALQYALTWSTDGLINEYCNPCLALNEGKLLELMPLEGLESIELDGMLYEAFNTSGGVGNLVELFKDKIQLLNYKTIRYPGHSEKMQFLLQGLKLIHDRKTLKTILENAIPKTYQDEVLIYISVSGWRKGELFEENWTKKIYPKTIEGIIWSAIQLSTTSSVCAVVDIILNNKEQYQGFIAQETLPYKQFITNRFSSCFVE